MFSISRILILSMFLCCVPVAAMESSDTDDESKSVEGGGGGAAREESAGGLWGVLRRIRPGLQSYVASFFQRTDDQAPSEWEGVAVGALATGSSGGSALDVDSSNLQNLSAGGNALLMRFLDINTPLDIDLNGEAALICIVDPGTHTFGALVVSQVTGLSWPEQTRFLLDFKEKIGFVGDDVSFFSRVFLELYWVGSCESATRITISVDDAKRFVVH